MHIITIIGRPNVGKSTLFNLLLHKRKAITHARAGVTRDVQRAEVEYSGQQFCFLDTGGITQDGVFGAQVAELSIASVDSAHLVLVLASVEEITAEDEEIFSFVRKIKTPYLLVVNKVDNETREWASHEFYKYGLGEPITISALHNSNIDYLWKKIFETLCIGASVSLPETPVHLENTTHTDMQKSIRILIMGKPNTGKSSLFNALMGEEKTLVSDIPGTTRDAIELPFTYRGEQYILVDSAGIRKKNKVYDDVEYYSVHRAISAIERSDVVLLVIDVQEGLSDQDKKLASLIIRKGRGILLLLNKWDLIEDKEQRLVAEKDRICYFAPQMHFVPVCPISAKLQEGMQEMMEHVKTMYAQLHEKILTSVLNRDVQNWIAHTPPPMVKRSRGKLKFIVQISSNRVIFQARVNNTALFNESYRQFIVNNIRKTYQLKNVPLSVEFVRNT